MFKPIKHRRVYTEIVAQVKELINEGKLKPGDSLVSERELAESLQVSRASIREAFSALDLLGILESRPGEGTFIRQVPVTSIIEPLALIFMFYQDSQVEILEIRTILEVEAAALAALRGSLADFEKIREHLEDMEEDCRKEKVGELADAGFHLAIAEATRNKVLLRLMNTVSDLMVETMRTSREQLFLVRENREKLLRQHGRIYRAITGRDPEEAKKAMGEHLDFVREQWVLLEEERSR